MTVQVEVIDEISACISRLKISFDVKELFSGASRYEILNDDNMYILQGYDRYDIDVIVTTPYLNDIKFEILKIVFSKDFYNSQYLYIPDVLKSESKTFRICRLFEEFKYFMLLGVDDYINRYIDYINKINKENPFDETEFCPFEFKEDLMKLLGEQARVLPVDGVSGGVRIPKNREFGNNE